MIVWYNALELFGVKQSTDYMVASRASCGKQWCHTLYVISRLLFEIITWYCQYHFTVLILKTSTINRDYFVAWHEEWCRSFEIHPLLITKFLWLNTPTNIKSIISISSYLKPFCCIYHITRIYYSSCYHVTEGSTGV